MNPGLLYIWTKHESWVLFLCRRCESANKVCWFSFSGEFWTVRMMTHFPLLLRLDIQYGHSQNLNALFVFLTLRISGIYGINSPDKDILTNSWTATDVLLLLIAFVMSSSSFPYLCTVDFHFSFLSSHHHVSLSTHIYFSFPLALFTPCACAHWAICTTTAFQAFSLSNSRSVPLDPCC